MFFTTAQIFTLSPTPLLITSTGCIYMVVCIFMRLVPDLVPNLWKRTRYAHLVPEAGRAQGCAQGGTHKARTRTHKVRTRLRTRFSSTLCI